MTGAQFPTGVGVRTVECRAERSLESRVAPDRAAVTIDGRRRADR